jgi:hypothetical protein
MTAPANWYPDPQQPLSGVLRYWDGTAWTAHTHDPSAPARTAPVAQAQADPKHTTATSGSPDVTGTSDSDGLGHSAEQAPVRATDRKITTFNAKKVAQELADEVDSLAAKLRQQDRVLAEYGIADVAERARMSEELSAQLAALRSELAAAKTELATARQGLVQAHDQATLEEMGLFNYEHPAQTSAQLQGALEGVRAEIKAMVKSKSAVHAATGFTFNNSRAQGDKFVRNMSAIMLRAYNAEAENGIKSTKAGNLAAAQKRLTTVKDQIARQGSMINLTIDERYHSLRLREQEIAAAHLQRLAAEREAERERKAELREQKRVEAEMRAEKDRLEKERNHYLNSIAALQAKGDADGAARLTEKLADVDRAIEDVDYRAANIRAGYVYVISNVGSLGEGTVKIGMTRRLEPMERVKELGDASVPFTFDVHALFFSDDAVGVETMLHQTFAEQRVNKINLRREFFRVTPDEVLDVLKAHSVEVIEFNLSASADEFRASWPEGLPVGSQV